jgi:antitoxin component of RelBE/YafQ-DinJ toxin-antitoxin module
MAKYETVSVKVPAEMKQKLKKYGIKPSKLLRKTLEQEIRKREIEEIKTEIQDLGDALTRIDMADVVSTIRTDRDMR